MLCLKLNLCVGRRWGRERERENTERVHDSLQHDFVGRGKGKAPHNFSYMYFGKCSSQTACAHLNEKIYFLWNMLCFVTFKYVWIPWTQTYHPFIWSQLTNAGNKIPIPEFIIVSKTLVYQLRYIIAKHLWVKR